jgi:SAM-dependent methyltransferase
VMSYFLPEGYIERLGATQSYDIGGNDEWQDEVYREASILAKVLGLQTVLDFGCGSGFKLMKYFDEFATVGIDLAPTVARLNMKYPYRKWGVVGKSITMLPDLLICSDVIEHVDDPDDLLSLLKSLHPKWLVISTPDRGLMAENPKWTKALGPPGNGCHVREWAFSEFRKYINSHFEVVRHFHSSVEQCTQCVIATS